MYSLTLFIQLDIRHETKDDTLRALKRWFGNIADLRAKHKLVMLMRDNAGKYKSEEIMQFLDSKGIRSLFSTPKEQMQNGAAEPTINSIMLVARTVMVESDLVGRFWLRAATAGKDARNETFKERIGMSPHQAMYGDKKDVSDYQAFGCQAYVYEDKQMESTRHG